MFTTKSPVTVARAALAAGTRALPLYAQQVRAPVGGVETAEMSCFTVSAWERLENRCARMAVRAAVPTPEAYLCHAVGC